MVSTKLEVFDLWKKMVEEKLNKCESREEKEELFSELIDELLEDKNNLIKYIDYMFDKVKEDLDELFVETDELLEVKEES